MNRFTGRLKTLVATSLVVSNREAVNGVISFLAYVLAGLVIAGMAIVPILAPGMKGSPELFLNLIFFLIFFDIVTLQAKLTGTTLIEIRALGFFPISRTRSTVLRFTTFLVDKRLLLYLFPMLATAGSLITKGKWSSSVFALSLFLLFYLVISELLFALFPLLRRLSNRYSPRTVSQIVMLPLLFVFLLPSILHVKPVFMSKIPVVNQFAIGYKDAIDSNLSGATAQLGDLFVILLLLTAIFSAVDRIAMKAGGSLAWRSRPGRSGASESEVVHRAVKPREVSGGDVVPAAASAGRWKNVRLLFLDWTIRQKEERLLYVIVVYPFIGGMLLDGMAHRFHQLASSPVLPIFFITQLLGIAFMENQFTLHGLRLKHVSIHPMKPESYVRVKFFSVFLIVCTVNLVLTAALGFRLHMSAYGMLRGAIFSVFLPLVLVVSVTTLLLAFHEIYRHSLISLVIVVIVESVATAVYGLVMLSGLFFGALFVAGLLLVTLYLWIPAWGRKLALKFQTLLEESK